MPAATAPRQIEIPPLRPACPHLFGPDGEIDRTLLRAERERRLRVYQLGAAEPRFAARCIVQCRADPLWFFDNFASTFDPRIKLTVPMILWPKQRDYVTWVLERIAEAQDFVTEKSRDVGVTYMHVGIAVWCWRFDDGFKTTFCANKLDLVDVRGNPDSIFEKIRALIRGLPKWLLPEGWNRAKHDREALILNPQNGNVISGEGGDNAGRGGRSSLYVVDEAAHVERADRVNAATSANARSRGWTSSVNGNGNLFYRLAHGGDVGVFRFHWRDDPRKNDAWAAKKRRDLTPVVFAQEYDLDYGASIAGLVIPMPWVDAARELYRRLGDQIATFRAAKGVAGVDVGGGKAESVVVVKHGPVLGMPHARVDQDGVNMAYWALDIAKAENAGLLNYDAPGIGYHIGAILQRAEGSDVRVRGVNTGEPPTDVVWPDERTSRDKFANLKAELWWRAREAFNRSWLHLRHLDGDPEGIEYPANEVILMADDTELARQLSTPRYFRTERGKIMIETKDQLRSRGIASPDRADAAVLAFHDGTGVLFYIGA